MQNKVPSMTNWAIRKTKYNIIKWNFFLPAYILKIKTIVSFKNFTEDF